jgi:hypothetical protein
MKYWDGEHYVQKIYVGEKVSLRVTYILGIRVGYAEILGEYMG